MIRRIFNHVLWRTFPFWERFGVHILPIHFHSPLPNTRELRSHPEWFKKDHPMYGVDMAESRQMELLEKVIRPYEDEYRAAGGGSFGVDEKQMLTFAPANALALYAIIRKFRPQRMIEVGAGMSTRVSAAALVKNKQDGAPGRLTAIDPYPSPALKAGFDGLSELIAEPVEKIPLERFLELEENDILFIDSSHTVRIGCDVNYLFLTVLPQLKPGVIIHIHDIFFPREYLPHHYFGKGLKQIWQEQYLLQAFLMFNNEFQVLLSSSYLHFKRPGELKSLFPWYHENRCPSSFWMQRRPADKR